MEILLRAAGIGVGDEVLLSSYDYPGTFWAIERVGARPVLLDTAAHSWRIATASLEETYQPACKALVVSHLHGELQDVHALRDWCDDRGMLLIEDACQAIGATCLDRPVGSFGHAAVFSFGGGKLLSCGRGGAWATSSEALAIPARVAAGAGSGPYAMSELQAAAVMAQLPWLEAINSACRTFFGAFHEHLTARNCTWHFSPLGSLKTTAFYQCGWQLPSSIHEHSPDRSPEQARQELITSLRRTPAQAEAEILASLPVGAGFPGFHRRSTRRCRQASNLNNAIEAAQRTLVFHHSLVLQQQWTQQQLADWTIACIAAKA